MSDTTKVVICIEVECEKPMNKIELAQLACMRLTMHADIKNAEHVIPSSKIVYDRVDDLTYTGV